MGGSKIHLLTFGLVILGGILWGVEGLFKWNISSLFTGSIGWLDRAIYVLVGLSALYEIVTHKSTCKVCEAMAKKPQGASSAQM